MLTVAVARNFVSSSGGRPVPDTRNRDVKKFERRPRYCATIFDGQPPPASSAVPPSTPSVLPGPGGAWADGSPPSVGAPASSRSTAALGSGFGELVVVTSALGLMGGVPDGASFTSGGGIADFAFSAAVETCARRSAICWGVVSFQASGTLICLPPPSFRSGAS